jgi:CDP-glucose 4,6-dehydratase
MENQSGKMESMVIRQRLIDDYKGKKVFLTGHTGFKGAWMAAVLQELGAEVKGYALAHKSEKDLFPLLFANNTFESIIDDIRNIECLKREILSFEPDYIFHLAAQPLVRRSYKIPSETFEVNVIGTSNLLEAVTYLTKPCQVIIVTTDKVYENKELDFYYDENNVLGGYDPYSASKACAEMVVSSFRNSFFNTGNFESHKKSIASARAGNVIGGGDQSEDRLVPDIINALSNNKVIQVRNPSSIRPWQHVLEPVIGYLLLGSFMSSNPIQFSTAFNFGPVENDHISVKELVELAIDIWGSGSWANISDQKAPHEAGILQLSIQKAMSELEWTPKLNAKQAVEWTVNWYKQKDDTKVDFTFFQINQYLSL